MIKKTLITGTIFGVTAIVFGAFGAHALKELLTAQALSSFKTAVNYQMYHALFLLIFGVLQSKYGKKLTGVIYYFCTLGVLCFSGSIYFLVLNKSFHFVEVSKWFALITPLGGALLISAWIFLGVYLVKNVKEGLS
ncbi:MAG: uncharacterized membrane protein YgdD (TMEM256/DUF423 family) [Saprospiraceae bacterium]|jgi:uncharacterized membrane protein YgdD (TMEM256/DUF423 family)